MTETTNEPGLEQPEQEAPQAPKKHWQIFGWVVIFLMAVLILLNLFQVIDPEINQIALPSLVILYVVYIFARRRR